MFAHAKKYVRMKEVFAERPLSILLWQDRIRHALQDRREEPVSTFDLHSKGEKMGALEIIDLGALAIIEEIDNPRLRGIILIICLRMFPGGYDGGVS